MKKLSLFFAIALLCLFAFPIAGCSAPSYTAGSYSASEAVREISISARDRRVEVFQTEENFLRIDYFYNEKESYDIVCQEGILTMNLVYDKEWTDYIGGKGKKEERVIRVYLPEEMPATLSVDTTNEDILLSSVSVSEGLRLSANNGNIELKEVSAGQSLELTAKNGNVSGSIAGTYGEYRTEIQIKKGDSNLSDKSEGEKLLKIDVNNGDIAIQFQE